MTGKMELHGEGGEAGDALRRIQDFDPEILVREQELGSKFALREYVDPARRVIELFKLISPVHSRLRPMQKLRLSSRSPNNINRCLISFIR